MLLAVGSMKGSPGVTTAAVALAAGWPAGDVPVLVECDPAGGDLVARFRPEPYPGLVSLAAAARRTSEPGLLWQHRQRLPGGLPVVVGAIGGDQAKAALGALAASGGTEVFGQAAQTGRGVVADCGRVESGSAALPMVRAADALLLLARPRADELAHAAALLPAAAGWCARLCSAVAGAGRGGRPAVGGRPRVRDTADGDMFTCGKGPAWTPGADPKAASPDCGQVYSGPSRTVSGGRCTVTATITWQVTWSGGGATGTEPALTSTASVPVAVVESAAVNTRW
jgi:hypothetical protein